MYVELEGVGSVKDNVTVNFTKMAFDLQILGLNGKNYRLLKDNLDKDIDPAKSKIIVKKNEDEQPGVFKGNLMTHINRSSNHDVANYSSHFD